MNTNKKYAIRKLAVGIASVSIGMFISNTPEVAQTLDSVGGGIIHAFDNGTENTSNETTKEWKPEGSIIARGEDGVPWELYENGYLLFKPEPGKDTLSNDSGSTRWKENYGKQIKAIGFSGKVYAPEDSSYLFSWDSKMSKKIIFESLQYIDSVKIDTSRVINMESMFFGQRKLKQINVSEWNTSNVTNMSRMFFELQEVIDLNVNKWNTSKVTDMSLMFAQTHNLKNLDVSKWDTSKVTNMSSMFSGAKSLVTLDVSKWDTSNVINMHGMFEDVQSLTTLDVSKWNTSNVTDMGFMFSFTSETIEYDLVNFVSKDKLSYLNVSKWDTSKVTDMGAMFWGRDKLNNIDVNNWNIKNVVYMDGMFGWSGIKKLDIGNWNTNNVKKMSEIFYNMRSLEYLNIENWNTVNIEEDTHDVFSDLISLKKIKIGTNFANTKKYKGNLFDSLDIFYYDYNTMKYNKGEYKWSKDDKTTPFYTVEEWNKEYKANPDKIAGVWVRKKDLKEYRINFITKTSEIIETIDIEKDTQATLSTPTVDNTGYKFLGWSKTQDGEVITDTTNIGTPGETIILYAKWEKVDNTTKQRVPIEVTTVYQGDNSLNKGQRNEEEGQVGEKEIITIYKVTPITGELTEPTITENIITPMRPKIIKVGTKPTVVLETLPSPVRYEKDNSRDKGQENITVQGKDGTKTTTTTYTVNPETGEVEAHPQEPVIVEPTTTTIKVALKDKVEIVNKDDGSVVKETTSYTINEKTGEITETKTEEVIKKKVETSKDEDTPPTIENSPEFIGGVNSIDTPVVEELPELKVAIIKDKENNILDVIKENETPKDIEGYKNTGKTEIDKNGYKVYIYEKTEEHSKGNELPSVVENKDFVGGVNSNDVPVVEELPELKVAIIKDSEGNILDVIKLEEEPKEIKGYRNTGKTEVDKDGNKVYIYEKIKENKKPVVEDKKVNLKENNKEVIKKKEELPKTTASMLAPFGLLTGLALRRKKK